MTVAAGRPDPALGDARGARWGPALGRPRWWLVIAGYAAALGAGWLYGVALRAGGDWNDGARWERALLLSVDTSLPSLLDAFLYAVPWAGTNLTLGPFVGLLAGWLLWQGRRDLATWIAVVELGVLSLNWLVKHLLPRDRPEIIERVGWYGWASYPSGHVMSSLAVLITLGMLAHRATGRRWPIGAAVVAFALISWSRLLHGVHWPTDVVGGMLVGLVWLVATWFAFVGLPRRSD